MKAQQSKDGSPKDGEFREYFKADAAISQRAATKAMGVVSCTGSSPIFVDVFCQYARGALCKNEALRIAGRRLLPVDRHLLDLLLHRLKAPR